MFAPNNAKKFVLFAKLEMEIITIDMIEHLLYAENLLVSFSHGVHQFNYKEF